MSHVVVIGAGAVGCLSALELAARGWKVTLVDKGALGAESSWAGGGILFPLLPWRYTEPVNRLALVGAAAYAHLSNELLQETGIDPQYRPCGMLVKADFGGKVALDWCEAQGIRAEMRDGDIWLPDVAQARNPRLMQALRAMLHKRGVRVVEHTELVPLSESGGAIRSWRSADGDQFEADAYVVTAGAWSSKLLGVHAMHVQIKPMRGQMLLYKLEPELLPNILYREDFYLIPRLDGHILGGSTVEDVGFDKSNTDDAMASLAEKASALLPQLADAPIVQCWSGLRPGSPDNVPVIACHPQFDNLWLNAGHFRYGVTMAPASAKILVALMAGETHVAGDYSFPDGFSSGT